ncbi:MAG: T9SS type A sorting domain-containing protein, partial [Flavobacteriales bacterium]|nr:T9SS type A sorting domain-containing protein [Flavobacteriales bacterium]
VKDVLTLESNEKLQVEVFTILGEKIMELHLENLVTIDFSKNTPGVYFIKAFSTSGSKTFKIVKN